MERNGTLWNFTFWGKVPELYGTFLMCFMERNNYACIMSCWSKKYIQGSKFEYNVVIQEAQLLLGDRAMRKHAKDC